MVHKSLEYIFHGIVRAKDSIRLRIHKSDFGSVFQNWSTFGVNLLNGGQVQYFNSLIADHLADYDFSSNTENFTLSDYSGLGCIATETRITEGSTSKIITGTADSYIFSMVGSVQLTKGVFTDIDMLIPFNSKVLFESNASGTVTNVANFRAQQHKWGSGVFTVTNWYGFLSDFTDKNAGTTITNGWHFYGKGDYPSYFGGFIDNSAKNAVNYALSGGAGATPLVADFNTAFGSDAPDGFIGILKDSQHATNTWLATRDYAGTWNHIQLVRTNIA
jgi:hypothetical protein